MAVRPRRRRLECVVLSGNNNFTGSAHSRSNAEERYRARFLVRLRVRSAPALCSASPRESCGSRWLPCTPCSPSQHRMHRSLGLGLLPQPALLLLRRHGWSTMPSCKAPGTQPSTRDGGVIEEPAVGHISPYRAGTTRVHSDFASLRRTDTTDQKGGTVKVNSMPARMHAVVTAEP